ELIDKIRANTLWIEETLELDVGQFLNLLFRVVDAPLLLNPRPDLAHDLLDVDGVGANVEFRHKKAQGSGLEAQGHTRDTRVHLPLTPHPLPLLKLLPNSGASLRHVPRMPIERMSAFI